MPFLWLLPCVQRRLHRPTRPPPPPTSSLRIPRVLSPSRGGCTIAPCARTHRRTSRLFFFSRFCPVSPRAATPRPFGVWRGPRAVFFFFEVLYLRGDERRRRIVCGRARVRAVWGRSWQVSLASLARSPSPSFFLLPLTRSNSCDETPAFPSPLPCLVDPTSASVFGFCCPGWWRCCRRRAAWHSLLEANTETKVLCARTREHACV